jgi:hypothetical protein
MVSMVLVAISSLLNRSLGAITSGKEYFIASKLAVEGLEYVRARRNNNLTVATTDPNAWVTGLTGTCGIDATNAGGLRPGTSICGGSATQPLCMNGDGQFTYNCSGQNALQGNFTRQITMQPSLIQGYVVVRATVNWDPEGGNSTQNKPFVLSTVLYKTQ